ncbi:MAG: cytochrome b/b6 domain-containing protein [Xanthomonadales bacterium]|nr:cytochrome b/b6 domain-containing protein [Xanthomonadales bacterium]MBK7146540.1 cytochrome b/b6 domain-containing protein [Xanthomonadales bacterium]MCC6563102.1 cytochrome b/b6 domain-containing protein [Xanthomonadales bacterium]
MNTTSESRNSKPRPASILVWDLPVRVFHWAMVICFAGAWLTAESERQRLLHVAFGYTLAGLVAFRVLWGFVGTRHARFAAFVRGPRALAGYLRGLWSGTPPHCVGHNPAGGWAILALLALAVAVAASGIVTYQEWLGDGFEEVHEVAASLMLLVVGVHVVGVLASSRLHHENLVAAMFSGRKHGLPADGIGSARNVLGAALLCSALGFWVWQAWPPEAPAVEAAAEQR